MSLENKCQPDFSAHVSDRPIAQNTMAWAAFGQDRTPKDPLPPAPSLSNTTGPVWAGHQGVGNPPGQVLGLALALEAPLLPGKQ